MDAVKANAKYEIKPCLAVDFDGTVRHSKADPEGFIQGPDDVAVYEGAYEVLADYRTRGFYVIGITNQGGVAYGHRTPEQVRAETRVTQRLLNDVFHDVFSCYSMEDATVSPWNLRSLGRKPDYGMLALAEFKALHDHAIIIDWKMSLIVGDSSDDYQLAIKAKIPFHGANDFFSRDEAFHRRLIETSIAHREAQRLTAYETSEIICDETPESKGEQPMTTRFAGESALDAVVHHNSLDIVEEDEFREYVIRHSGHQPEDLDAEALQGFFVGWRNATGGGDPETEV